MVNHPNAPVTARDKHTGYPMVTLPASGPGNSERPTPCGVGLS
jgi:hypothetical protein